ncbi:Threonyl/alanyl tRNA synthetase [Leucosporidium creatinivorum]|uniref:Threonyl/alanyl tRNA synthetase n=1 Tax=Leucosporidium creatinivorum TaxID=106004 RepID=A0A1Y2FI10_9BASI|nr:Threonyl/alanyl tRNA synthetase [Leucosporidium creatinivorum]
MFSIPPTPPHLLQAPATATPPSYLHSNIELPARRYVGMLACQRDPLLERLTTRVVSCSKRAPAPAPPAKGKKSKVVVEEAQPDEWEIELEDTVLFPEGGGQPSDTGSLFEIRDGVVSEGQAPVVVREVLRRGLDAIHYASRPLEVGAQVLVKLDVERRIDLMAQHTGQHLLSAILERDLQLDTLSWSLTKAPELCYIELPRAPSPEELASLQQKCNEVIARGTEVRVKMELAGEGGVALGEKVPTNYQDGERPPVMRTVEIVDLDNNPCCGTHYPSLAALGSLFVSPYTTPIRGTNARIYFCVGPRVLRQLSTAESLIRSSTQELGCAITDLPERVAALKLSYNDTSKREKRLKDELAGFVAESLWGKAMRAAGEGGPVTAISFREEDATNSLDFLSAVSLALKPRIDALPKGQKNLFALASGSTAGSSTPNGGALLIFGSEDLVVKAGKSVAAKFGARVKGGGKGRWQGKLVGQSWAKGDEQLMSDVIDEAKQ